MTKASPGLPDIFCGQHCEPAPCLTHVKPWGAASREWSHQGHPAQCPAWIIVKPGWKAAPETGRSVNPASRDATDQGYWDPGKK
jgi:hypothetical protein